MVSNSNIGRRKYLQAAGAASIAALAGCAEAGGEYPNEEIVLMNPYPPGGGTDVYFSAFTKPMKDEFGVEVRQEYESGAEGAIAHRNMVNSDSQYQLTNINIPLHTLVQINQENPGYDLRDMTGIGGFAWDSVIIVTPADSEYTEIGQLQEAFQSGDLTKFGGVGSGNTFHMTAWQMKNKWDLNYQNYVGYDGGGSLISSVLRGEVDAGLVGVVPAKQYVDEGEVNGVIVAGDEPHPSVPDVEVSGDKNLESVASTAVFTRAMFGTPSLESENRQRLTEGFMNVLESDAVTSWSDDSGNPVIPEEADPVQTKLEDSFDIREIYDEFKKDTS